MKLYFILVPVLLLFAAGWDNPGCGCKHKGYCKYDGEKVTEPRCFSYSEDCEYLVKDNDELSCAQREIWCYNGVYECWADKEVCWEKAVENGYRPSVCE